MGGVGKTALSVVLAHRLKDRYPDAQLFLNLRGADPDHRPPVPPADAMQFIIHSFRPEARLPESVDELTSIYHSVLTASGRTLLVLDNAADAAQVRPLVPPRNCLLLVTSRQQFQVPGMVSRNLDCLSPSESHALLLKLAQRLEDHADRAAELCGYLPPALEVFAGTVTTKRLYPVSELLERLRARQDKLLPVEAAFQVSYELLAEDLRRQWVQLSVFPASFDLQAAAELWGKDADATRESMQTLVYSSVVAWNESNGRFRLHDLVKQFCERRLSETDADVARVRHAKHYTVAR